MSNVIYYRAAPQFDRQGWRSEFLVHTKNNFLDIAILEWCKVFSSKKEKHYYTRLSLPAEAITEIDSKVHKDPEFLASVKRYRDKFLSHLDQDDDAAPPKLDVIQSTASYTFEQLRQKYKEYFQGPPAPDWDELEKFGRDHWRKLVPPNAR